MKNTIEVWLKDCFADAEGDSTARELRAAGLKELKAARVGKVYELDGDLTPEQLQRVARELLADSVTEIFYINDRRPSSGYDRSEIWLKKSVSDVMGESVGEAVKSMMGVECRVRCGAAYLLEGEFQDSPSATVRRTLVNAVIHEHRTS